MADFDIEEDNNDQILTPEELVSLFMEGWQNERLSPELLPHLGEYAECMMEQVSQMEENIKQLDKKDIRRDVHRFELTRMQYLINSYLRMRIDKIEMNALKLVQDESNRNEDEQFLSDGERKFATEYLQYFNRLSSSLLANMPQNARQLELDHAIIEPNLESHVFIRAKKDITVIVPDEIEGQEDEIKLETNSQHILPYKCVMNHIKNGDVQLI